MDPNIAIIKELSQKLAANLISISFDDNSQIENACREIFNPPGSGYAGAHQKERFIAVIGAGASHNAIRNLNLGKTAPALIYKLHSPEIRNLSEKEILRLSQVYRLEPADFETKLLAISKYSDQMDEVLDGMYKYRYYPDRFYEILAHLLKNRFIDAIINFNFDELLDQAIDDELVSGTYKKVISDGDLPNFFFDIIKDHRFKIPLYVKPHGTISHKTSLKFTRDDYFNTSSDINRLLAELLSGKLVENDPGSIPVNLLVFGFNMESFEFNKLLANHLPDDSRIYFFDLDEKPLRKIDGNFKGKRIQSVHLRRDLKGKYSTDLILETLYQEIERLFKEEYKPRNIKRHVIISRLFSDVSATKRTKKEQVSYLQDRIYVELLLLIAKSYGLISLQQISCDRVGIYHQLYQKYRNAEDGGRKRNKNAGPLPLLDFCRKLKLTPYGYSRDLFSLKNLNDDSAQINTIDIDDFKKVFLKPGSHEYLVDRLKPLVSEKLWKRIKSKGREKEFRDALLELFKSGDTEICPRYDGIHDNVFRDPKVIKTKLELDYQTKIEFNEKGVREWDLLLSIAETGEWISHMSAEALSGKNIALIVADRRFEQTFQGKNIQVFHLNWWLHNQHMSLFLKNINSAPRPGPLKSLNEWPTFFKIVKVIYFSRRSKSSLINPILLNDDDDRELALKTFFAYVAKSNQYEYPNIIRQRDVNKAGIEYFNKYLQGFQVERQG